MLLGILQLSRIRFITDIAPTESLTAGIVLEQIVKLIPLEIDIECEILVDDALPNYQISNYLNPTSCRWYRKPQEMWPRHPVFYIAKFAGDLFSKLESKKIGKHILQEESRNSSDLIVVVIQGQTSIRIANQLIQNGYKVVTVHWDPWDWWKREKNVLSTFDKEVHALNASIMNSGAHLLPSENFKSALQLGVSQGVVLYPHIGLAEKVSSQNSKIRFVFIGQLYSKDEISEFLEFLNEMDWKLNGIEVELHLYGNSKVRSSTHIIQHGWVQYEKIVQLISEYDVAFLPYPRSKLFEQVAKQSFPSKLATYVAANLPIIYLGPNYSSFEDLIENFGLKLEKIPRSLWSNSIVDFIRQRESLSSNERLAYEQTFSLNAQKKSVNHWLKLNSLPINFLNTPRKRSTEQVTVRELESPITFKRTSVRVGRLILAVARMVGYPNRIIIYLGNKFRKLVILVWKAFRFTSAQGGLKRVLRLFRIFLAAPRIVVSQIKNHRIDL